MFRIERKGWKELVLTIHRHRRHLILPALDLKSALSAEHAEQRRPYHGAAVAREAVRRPRDVLQVAQLQPAPGGEAVGRHGAGPGPPVPASGQQQDLARAVNEVSRKKT